MKTTVNPHPNKREEKKQVNIVWNSRLMFQVGIIVSCLIVFFVMQTSFKTELSSNTKDKGYTLVDPPMIDYLLDIELPKSEASPKKDPIKVTTIPKRVKSDVIVVKKNSDVEAETSVGPTDIPVAEPAVQYVPEPTTPEPTGPSSILNVEFVPVFPGCESLATNAQKIDCMSSQINTFINRNFRKEFLENLERNQVQRIYVQFKIDSKGFITDVRANSSNEKLKNEAIRVVANLPKMKPGRQGDKNVDVLYTVPIVFQVQ